MHDDPEMHHGPGMGDEADGTEVAGELPHGARR